MKDLEHHDESNWAGQDYDDDLREMGIPFDEEEACRLTRHQLDIESLLKRCNKEIDISVAADEQARAEKDIIGQLTHAYRRQSLYGYRFGLQRLQEVLSNLAEGSEVGDGSYLFSPDWHEQLRQEVVHDFVHVNEEFLRRLEKKVEREASDN